MPRQGLVNEIRLKTKRHFAKVLRQHLAKSVAEISSKATSEPNFVWKLLKRDNSKAYNAFKITSDQWYGYFKSEFSKPDPSLSNQYERELDGCFG
jgi:hypothetical protein